MNSDGVTPEKENDDMESGHSTEKNHPPIEESPQMEQMIGRENRRMVKSGCTLAAIAAILIILAAASTGMWGGEAEKLPMIGKQLARWSGQQNLTPIETGISSDEPVRSVPVNQSVVVPNGTLTVEELVLFPTRTAVRLSFKGKGNAHAPVISKGIMIKTPEGVLESNRGRASGQLVGDTWEQSYECGFPPLDPAAGEFTIDLSCQVYMEGETRIPLQGGASVIAPNGRRVAVAGIKEEGTKGKAVISYTNDSMVPFPFDNTQWQVVYDNREINKTERSDEQGRSIITGWIPTPGETGPDPGESRVTLEWELPPGRQATALVNPGCFEYRDSLGTFKIEIPEK